ncbi:AraC family transcriptional regulator [Azospirillum rugosum]|uniref:AraC-like DNA-binding protein n=1 Tax=Azospirillum rugosum TaxID=416170 RepID=A0ABS4SWJ1_9PROT|nr:helix-turn-helix domain-containing protein [Azospirillum rugosum]MBP2296926.1 AraC-like DNA-binding protein [Azospirillum rugosum]MDQ0530685.1 AraC-like DNA-binding protein [Azospirillum rugosum]
MASTRSARLLFPRAALGACVFVGMERDTRGRTLTDDQRFNHFPASPLAVVSWIFDGTLHMVEEREPEGAPQLGQPLPRLFLTGPQRRPFASWSPGPVHALSVAFYPEALARLTGAGADQLIDRIRPLEEVASDPFLAACRSLFDAGPDDAPFRRLEEQLDPLWSGPCPRDARVAPLLGDWLRTLAAKAVLSRAGRGVRQIQRRIKEATGQSQRDLQLFARVEEAVVRASAARDGAPLDLAGLAGDAGFADQSHMGRDIRRVTGLPPGRLDERVARDEAFWFYRLIGESLGGK